MASLKTSLDLKTLSRWLSDESLTKKASLNALASVLDYGVQLAVGFVVNPLLVAGLGDYLYGAWQVLGRLLSYISPASGRPAQALKWTIANQQASTDYDAKRRHVGSAIAVWLLFLPLLTVLGAVLAWFAPSWLDAPEELSRSLRLAAVLLVANLIAVSLATVPRSVLEGENLGYKRMGLSAILVIVGGALTVLALYAGTGIAGVAAANLASTLLTGALFLQVARTVVPWFGIARPQFDAVRQFLGLSWWFLGWNFIMMLMRGSDVVLLGILDSVEMVTTYTLTKYVPETLVSLVAIVVFGITPGLGGIIGSGDFEKAVRVRSEIMALTWLIVTIAGATILLWLQDFLTLWVGPEYYAGGVSTMLILVMVAQFVLIRNDANIIDLTLNLRRKVLLGALSTALALGMAGLLVAYLDQGIVGLCLGFIAGRSILSIAYPWLIARFLEVSFSSQLKSVFRPALITGLLFVVASALASPFTVGTWFGLVLSVGFTLVVVSLLAFFAGLSIDQRKRILQRARLLSGRP